VLQSGTEARASSAAFADIAHRPGHQAFLILYAGYIALPMIAGADKFFDYLVNWDDYLAPQVIDALPIAPHTFMLVVGVIELVAGLLLAFRPQVGAYVVALWLCGIMLNLILDGSYDVALRDFGLALGALALARLSNEFPGSTPSSHFRSGSSALNL